MSEAVERLAEPAATAHLRALLVHARRGLTPSQRLEMEQWGEAHVLNGTVLSAIRTNASDGAALREHARELAYRRRKRPAGTADDHLDRVPHLLTHAATRPAVVSAILWTWLGGQDPDFASHLLQVVRERARLPGLRRRLLADDPVLGSAAGNLPALVARFGDRQVEDAGAWIEHVPPPFGSGDGATLSSQLTAIEQARAAAPRLPADELTGFARRAATFLVQLSVQRLDPLGFPLAREAQLEADPPLERRLEITAWARRAGHMLCPRGRMLVLGIAVQAPWELRLELIAAELGRGQCGGCGVLLRLHGGGPIAVSRPAPVLLFLPGEAPEERGQRFERWLETAYPYATQAWHPWS